MNEIGYTLQVAREPMAHRLAFLCRDADEGARTLADCAQGREAEGLFRGVRNRETVDFWDAALLEPLYAQRAWRKLARLWVDGVEIDSAAAIR